MATPQPERSSDDGGAAGLEAPFKPAIRPGQVLAVLHETFEGPITGLTPLRGGQLARVFAFTAEDHDYVVRLTTADNSSGFEKEAFIARHITTAGVPIPAIIRTGRWQDVHFAISAFAAGVPFDALDESASARVSPSLIAILDAIHASDIRAWSGAGPFDAGGAGQFPSWREYLASVREEESTGFYGRWHTLFTDSFLERDLFDDVYARMLALLPRCPEERFLVHGDYGFDNVLVDEERITAVLDWSNAKYGDFLYDIAWLHFFPSHENFAARVREHYAATGRVVPDYEDRLRCYVCFIGLESLRFFAKAGQRPHYDWARQRLLDLLDTSLGG
jgi:hygromycin-B 4-O-kinase